MSLVRALGVGGCVSLRRLSLGWNGLGDEDLDPFYAAMAQQHLPCLQVSRDTSMVFDSYECYVCLWGGNLDTFERGHGGLRGLFCNVLLGVLKHR